jgi:hypothetical protein
MESLKCGIPTSIFRVSFVFAQALLHTNRVEYGTSKKLVEGRYTNFKDHIIDIYQALSNSDILKCCAFLNKTHGLAPLQTRGIVHGSKIYFKQAQGKKGDLYFLSPSRLRTSSRHELSGAQHPTPAC